MTATVGSVAGWQTYSRATSWLLCVLVENEVTWSPFSNTNQQDSDRRICRLSRSPALKGQQLLERRVGRTKPEGAPPRLPHNSAPRKCLSRSRCCYQANSVRLDLFCFGEVDGSTFIAAGRVGRPVWYRVLTGHPWRRPNQDDLRRVLMLYTYRTIIHNIPLTTSCEKSPASFDEVTYEKYGIMKDSAGSPRGASRERDIGRRRSGGGRKRGGAGGEEDAYRRRWLRHIK